MITENLIYCHTFRPSHHEKGLHTLRLTEECNAYVCWHFEETCQEDPEAQWIILWHEWKWNKNKAIERAVDEVRTLINAEKL